LDPERVLEIVEESEGSTGLSGITVKFRNGSTLRDLDTYRERHVIQVQEVRPGMPAITEIETAMVDYLNELATPNQNYLRIIDENGLFVVQ
jgi:hypothetical protein